MVHSRSLRAFSPVLCVLWLGLAAGAAADVQTYSSSPNAFIPDALPPGPGTPQSVTDTILVGDSGTINDLEVTVTVRHPQTADVAIDLTDPSGTVTVRLFNRDGGVGDGLYDVTFDDEAGGPPPDFLTNGQCLVSTSFTPSGNLSDFDGLELQGTWTITVTDHAFSDASDCDCDGLDVGPSCPRTLDEWSMEIDFTPTPDNLAPVAQCQDVTVAADQTSCTAAADVDDGSFDPDGDPITLEQDPPGPYAPGDTLVTLTVTDDGDLSDTCQATVTVVDEAAPEIQCNAPATITPPDAPISFTATATDACGPAAAQVAAYDCSTFTKKGKRIDKTGSCAVQIDGDTVTVVDSGGVGTTIEWTVEATDGAGNGIVMVCGVVVVNPGQTP
jgi:subtilisin-like proprotein convertase family protein